MAFRGLGQRRVDARGGGLVYNPAPGGPAPPPGWHPREGWKPDPAWPPAPADWEFWKPAPQGGGQAADNVPAPAGAIHLTLDGQTYDFQPGQPARIGRATDNDVVLGDPAVSRKHAQLSWTPDGWVFENVGQAPTFLGGQSVTRVAVSQAVELTLGSAHGPVLRLDPSPAPGPQQVPAAEDPARPGGTEPIPGPGPGPGPGPDLGLGPWHNPPAAPASDELVEAF